MNKKIILFDIDGTLIDASLIGDMVYSKISEVSGLDERKIREIKDEFRLKVTGYHVTDLVDYISQKSGINLTSLKNFLDSESIYSTYIYDDVRDVLSKLSEDNNLGIFSDGDLNYQNKKISSIKEFFQDNLIFITIGKLMNGFLEKIPNGAMIIDDDKNVLEKLKQLRPDLELVWINRENEEKMEGIRTIQSLKELL